MVLTLDPNLEPSNGESSDPICFGINGGCFMENKISDEARDIFSRGFYIFSFH